ncbi:hypothetical protein A4X13_0g6429 [Tilletia indica]|uniref:Uncharacterized protein n=1 Tax=Tilletia indica TaxID=43049 RepID=A0A177T4U2_9BASI|nr:hypothetical protein A4X13_0g6429 [Tilletia indica]
MATDALRSSASAVPDLLGSEPDFDQLPSSPAFGNGTEAAPVVIQDDEQEEEDDDEDLDEGGDAEEENDDDDYEILEYQHAAGQSTSTQTGANAGGGAEDGPDADELAGDEDVLGLGTHSTITHVDAADEGDDDDDGDQEEDADAGDEFLPTVLIDFEDSLFDLFAQQAGDGKHDSEENAIPLKASSDILNQPLSNLFATLRIPDALGEFLEKDTALVLRSPEVDLEMAENDATAEQVLLQDFLDIHPSNSNGDAVRLRFSQRQSFLTRFKSLGGVVNAAPSHAALSPTTAVSSWMSRAKSGARRATGGDDEPDELDDEAGAADGGTLGEHHEPDDDDEGREPEWEEGEGEGELNEHWEGEGEGEGEDDEEGEEEGEGEDEVILIEDDDEQEGDTEPNLEEGYEEGDEILDADADHNPEGAAAVDGHQLHADEHGEVEQEYEEAGGEEGDEEYEEHEEAEQPSTARTETVGEAEDSVQPTIADSAPALAAWKEPASSATNAVPLPTNGNGQGIPDQDDEGEYEQDAPGDLVDRAGALGATSSLTGKRSFDETDIDLPEGDADDGAKRLKV